MICSILYAIAKRQIKTLKTLKKRTHTFTRDQPDEAKSDHTSKKTALAFICGLGHAWGAGN